MQIGMKVCQNYTIEKKIDNGHFGTVFLVKRDEPLNNNLYFAVKLQKKNDQKNKINLYQEACILKELKDFSGFPKLLYYLKEDENNTRSMVL